MKYYILSVIILLSSFLIYSCDPFNSGCKKISLTKSEKEWFNFYRSGTKYLFKSDLGNIDTFFVKEKSDDFTDCNQFELGKYQYNEFAVLLKSSNCHSGVSSRCGFLLSFKAFTMNGEIQPCEKYFSVFNTLSEDVSNIDSLIEQENILVNNKYYNTYKFVFGVHTSDINSSSPVITSFNWNKEKGLLRYILFKKEIFTFWKTI